LSTGKITRYAIAWADVRCGAGTESHGYVARWGSAGEGVEADDYPTSQALLSLLRNDGKEHITAFTDVPADYADFQVVEHQREIEAS
jgi:hypothetical protein